MAKGVRTGISAALVLSLLSFLSPFVAPANAAACSVAYGTVSGTTRYAIFNSGTACTWSVPAGVTNISSLAVGGGGGGGGGRAYNASINLGGGGGGGGGNVIASSISTTGGTTFTMTIGTGGAGGAASVNGSNGAATTISYSSNTITAGGGYGGAGSNSTFDQANLSGDGGGNVFYGGGASDWDGGGGGAGSSAIGSNGIDIGGQGGTGGAGGAGTSSALLGATNYYGGGGGGGGTPSANSGENNGYGGAGGSSVGGTGGGGPGVLPTAGATNTGSGGGGGGWRYSSADSLRAGAAGASGTVVFVYTKTAGSISSVSITSSAGADNTYIINDYIIVSVTTSEVVTVVGNPRILLTGLTSKYLLYLSGSGSSTLLFRYTVAQSDTASAGVGIGANSLDLNTGSIVDTSGLAITLTHSAISQSALHKVDGIKPTVTYTATSNVPENESRSVTLTLSESGTVTLSAGGDRAHVLYDAATKTITFTPHDFENKQDQDLNNQYYVGFSITDASGNTGAGSYNIFFTVTDVAESAAIAKPALSAAAVKGVTVTITVTTDVAGKVDFYWNGKRIPGCIARATSGVSPNFSATCNWKPAAKVVSNIYAFIKPTSSSYTNSTSAMLTVLPAARTGLR